MSKREKGYGTRWLTFWVYFRLPIGILISSFIIVSNVVNAVRNDYFSIPIYSVFVAIDAALVFLESATFINMHQMTETGYRLNHILIVVECISSILYSWVHYGIINPLFFLLWWLPNFVYFRHRKFLFNGQLKLSELETVYVKDPKDEVQSLEKSYDNTEDISDYNTNTKEYKYICNSCGKPSTGWYQTCPNCGAVGKMEKASPARIQAAEHLQDRENKIIASGGWKCEKCGKAHFANESSCSCGASRFVANNQETINKPMDEDMHNMSREMSGDAPVIFPQIGVSENQKAICDNCGAILPVGAKFCSNCGQAIIVLPVVKYCRFCGSKLEENSKFCSQCGKQLV